MLLGWKNGSVVKHIYCSCRGPESTVLSTKPKSWIDITFDGSIGVYLFRALANFLESRKVDIKYHKFLFICMYVCVLISVWMFMVDSHCVFYCNTNRVCLKLCSSTILHELLFLVHDQIPDIICPVLFIAADCAMSVHNTHLRPQNSAGRVWRVPLSSGQDWATQWIPGPGIHRI